MKSAPSSRASLAVSVEPSSPTLVSKAARKKTVKRKPKPCTESSREETIGLIKKAVRDSGYRVVSVQNLLRSFGYQKRSEANVRQITEWLAAQNLTVHPKLSLQLKPSQCLRVYGFPVAQLGDLFETDEAKPAKGVRKQRERELEEFIHANDLFQQLGLTLQERQHSPKETRNRFDFLCTDANDALVVLELKHEDGGKSAVEQVLRYLGMLKQQHPKRKARGILVTGIRDVDTAKALYGMTPAQQKEIDWYLYHYRKGEGLLGFELVGYDFIEKHLNVVH